jgi:hypothetical protein
MAEHIIDDEGIQDPELRKWFDNMADRHNAEETSPDEVTDGAVPAQLAQ